jgi:hypothetical protein
MLVTLTLMLTDDDVAQAISWSHGPMQHRVRFPRMFRCGTERGGASTM